MVLVGCWPTAVVTSTDASTGTTVVEVDAISTATPTTGDGGTNAVPSPDLPPAIDPEVACAALCAAEARCREVPVQPECVPDCVAGLGDGPGDEPACSATDALLTACRAELACEVLLDEGGYRACEPELRAMLTACGLCMFDYGWIDADTCYLDDLCPDGHHRIECDAQTCVCTHDGMFLGSCPSQGCENGAPVNAFSCCVP